MELRNQVGNGLVRQKTVITAAKHASGEATHGRFRLKVKITEHGIRLPAAK